MNKIISLETTNKTMLFSRWNDSLQLSFKIETDDLFSFKNSIDITIDKSGFILEDNDGQIIYEDSSLVKVNNQNGINSRTLDFLNRKKEDFKNAATPEQFYKIFQES